jgi:hypothetical protein
MKYMISRKEVAPQKNTKNRDRNSVTIKDRRVNDDGINLSCFFGLSNVFANATATRSE